MKLRTRFAGAVAATLFATTLIPSTPAVAGTCYRFKHAERSFARKTNRTRKAHGKVALHLDPQLSKVARRHTSEMVSNTTLYHTPSSKLRRRVTRWIILGENVGVGNTVDSLERAFMHSREHRENILYSSFRHIGVGTKKKNGRLWVTVVFESRRDPGTRLSMPSC